MIFTDPSFRKEIPQALALCAAIFAASEIEGEVLVRTQNPHIQTGVGAHSIGVSTLLFLGFADLASSVKRNGYSRRNNIVHITVAGILFTGLLFHLYHLVHLHQRGAPLDRLDPDIKRFVTFCRVFLLGSISCELLMLRLHPVPRLG